MAHGSGWSLFDFCMPQLPVNMQPLHVDQSEPHQSQPLIPAWPGESSSSGGGAAPGGTYQDMGGDSPKRHAWPMQAVTEWWHSLSPTRRVWMKRMAGLVAFIALVALVLGVMSTVAGGGGDATQAGTPSGAGNDKDGSLVGGGGSDSDSGGSRSPVPPSTPSQEPPLRVSPPPPPQPPSPPSNAPTEDPCSWNSLYLPDTVVPARYNLTLVRCSALDGLIMSHGMQRLSLIMCHQSTHLYNV
jgi:hypothetical protein